VQDYLSPLLEFLRIDTTSAKGKGAEGAKWLRDFMQDRGVNAELIPWPNANPYVIGEINVGSDRTLLIYNHYDVQPAEPLDKWDSDPFNPVVKDGRIYARGIADDKGTLMARLLKVIELWKAGELKVNVKFVYEGEEEIGSPHAFEFLSKFRERLRGDWLLWEGSGRAPNGAPEVVLGVKGLLYVEVRARTAKDLHSMYSPVADNPMWRIVYFLSEVRRPDGYVNLPGFYDKVRWLSREELEYLNLDPELLAKAINQEVKDGLAYVRLVSMPSLNIDGALTGYTGEGSKTVIPSYAFVKLDFRLVPDQDPEEVFKELGEVASKYGLELVKLGSVRPFRTPMSSRIAQALIRAAERVYGARPVVMPNSPGTGPMESFSRALGIKEIADGAGVVNYDSNIHSFNENAPVEDYYLAMKWAEEMIKELSSG
jgi:acetylornithine deacetylase/succinyl-diaminopimelate desuccinylase-like protein